MSVSLTSTVASPVPLGKLIRFTATAVAPDPGTLSYRFRTRWAGERTGRRQIELPLRTVVDFGPDTTFDWTTIDREGPYEIEASVKNNATGEVASASLPVTLMPLAKDSAAVTPTANPLVFIYSAPPCPEGSRMRVRFEGPDGVAQFTPFQDCRPRTTMNFYLAGFRPNSTISARHIVESGSGGVTGSVTSTGTSDVRFTAGDSTFQPPAAVPMSTPLPTVAPFLLNGPVSGVPFATDLSGNVVWYGPESFTFFTRVHAGAFLAIQEDGTQDTAHQFFREFDLAGVTLAQTNAARVNEQLAAHGVHPITSFHHEAIHLPDGKYLVLGGSERTLTDVQGAGPVEVLGDTILVFSPNLDLVWAWDAFDYLDPHRAAILNETCAYPATVACSVFYDYNAGQAHDWLHGNSLSLTPDGNILFSVRHQDWILKIDYRSGAGSGAVLWRLGAQGDFKIESDIENPWFSHQHDPHFLADNRTLFVFDNGNTRILRSDNTGTSRGQILDVDEAARTARLVLNTDLKANSSALGTMQLLPNGHIHYDLGFVVDPANPANRYSQSLEGDGNGNIVWGMRIAAQNYRSFRMNDLYTLAEP
jgi:hypothetical protein